jgi:hypothetical protein
MRPTPELAAQEKKPENPGGPREVRAGAYAQYPAGTAAPVAGTAASPSSGALTAKGRTSGKTPRFPGACGSPELLALADKELRSSVESRSASAASSVGWGIAGHLL